MALIIGEIPEIDKQSIAAGSMAYLIQEAFKNTWHKAMGEQPPPEYNKQMQLLFVAVAQGVIEHLKNNTLEVDFVINGTPYSGTVKIKT